MDDLPKLPKEQLDTLCHMLGLSEGVREPWRNYFASEPGDRELEELRQRGLVERWFVRWGLQYYRATPSGIQAALQYCKPPQLSKGQRRYRTWLNLNDAIQVSFRDFLTLPEFAEIRSKC